jgi:hypothetical protein
VSRDRAGRTCTCVRRVSECVQLYCIDFWSAIKFHCEIEPTSKLQYDNGITVHELTDASESGVGNFQRPGYILPAVKCHPVHVKLKIIRIFVNRCTDLDSDVFFSNC